MSLKKISEKFLNLSLRSKFILSFLLVFSFGGLLILSVGTRLEHTTIISLAQAKVKHDLAAAWMVYNDRLKNISDLVRLTSARFSLQEALLQKNRPMLETVLAPVMEEFNLDILSLTDDQGKIVFRAAHPELWGDDQSQDPFINRALKGQVISSTQIISRNELLKEGKDLAEQAFIRFITTPKAAPREKDYEENGMLLKSASPIIDQNGKVLGVLYGALLLNRNYEIVDKVKELVYKGEKYKGSDIGTATIFQQDLRIATNVKDIKGERAIGTRVSREVNQAVLKEGKPWVDRAFVVNDWYITAYEAIKNVEGKIIGMLYVGMLEKPYIDTRDRLMLTFTGMAILFVIILLIILTIITSSIIRPLRGMVVATDKIAQGDLNHRVKHTTFKDEIGRLAISFNEMTEKLKKANEKLVQWGKTLEKRVEERTLELRETQDFLVQSEKMASLGKMAAGVAHEINNPLTSILLQTHLMLEGIEEKHKFFDSLKLIADETARCTNIVKGLLEFSRQSPPQKKYAQINDILNRTIALLKNQASFQNIKIQLNLDNNLPATKLDQNKIQQVFWNFMVNASEAMPQGGQLTISSKLCKDKKTLEVTFKDTGVGISKENQAKLFDPFFTTKSSGTGLGLAISYGIIRQHKGNIAVESHPGKGTIFTVKFPLSDKNNEEQEKI
ncbi:MAG: cache domain-containing protein [Candidatus Aminicenantes bacterium]|nr:cache domain-containing protein [Candidatus Aminicenantes bacterium]